MTYPPLNPQPDDSNRFASNSTPFGEPGTASAAQPPAFSQQPPAFGEQPSAFSEQPPAFAEQPTAVLPAFGQQGSVYGEQPPAFPEYGRPEQPAAGGFQQPAYGAAAYSYPGFEPAPARRSSSLGTIALVLALVGVIAASVAGAVFALPIGEVFGKEIARLGGDTPEGFAWAIDVADSFLYAELAFWAGTALGITAFVLGIVSAVQRRGRGAGIAAAIVSGVGPVVFLGSVLVVVAVGAMPFVP